MLKVHVDVRDVPLVALLIVVGYAGEVCRAALGGAMPRLCVRAPNRATLSGKEVNLMAIAIAEQTDRVLDQFAASARSRGL